MTIRLIVEKDRHRRRLRRIVTRLGCADRRQRPLTHIPDRFNDGAGIIALNEMTAGS
jgi:hypothetical protein